MDTSLSDSISDPSMEIEERVARLLDDMTLAEKIGQMSQVNASEGYAPDYLAGGLRAGRIGSVINVVDVDVVNELQRIAAEESRLGIPLLVGRDVIHGFKTIMPIPLGQAATWNPALVKECARVAALEAVTAGINWTFAPMVDISRDPRWGRIAETLGEDPFLGAELAGAMIEGFQGDDLSSPGALAACAKHFAGYGAVESGRDYGSTDISEHELRNVHLRPFKAAVKAGVSSLMTSFSDLNGVPATANDFLLRQILREEWAYEGLVVSDWDSIRQLQVHGLTENDRESALAAVTAGVDMEMAGDAYINHLAGLVEEGRVPVAHIDAAVANILRLKFSLGLFENYRSDPLQFPTMGAGQALATARESAMQSIVMLKNDGGLLPLVPGRLKRIAIVGPLADDPYEQLGTWIFDGDSQLSVTPLQGIRELLGQDVDVRFAPAMETSRSKISSAFDEAVELVREADVAVLFLGEESILSGEAHCRADINLPGDQAELIRRIRKAGKPVVAVIMAGRPLSLGNIIDQVDAVLYAWHPGTMGGPAIADILFGKASPSGKLPVTFPRMVGQVPIYYGQKNTGKPPSEEGITLIDDIETRAAQTSFGMTAFHLDAGYTPLFVFGHGLSYAEFVYQQIRLSSAEIRVGETLTVSAQVTNTGKVAAEEVVQLYVRDLAGSVTRPVKELKGFRRIHLEPGQARRVEFVLGVDQLAFYGRDMQLKAEPGMFQVWIGGSSDAQLGAGFRLTQSN